MHARHVKHYTFLMLHGLIIWARAFLPPGLPSSGIAHHGSPTRILCRSHTQTRATAAAVGAARPFEEAAMEHGTVEDSSASTFSIAEEEHTLANPARFVLNQDPRVAFCGYGTAVY
uniref:DNA-directed RNA polymerase RBP11-like dimerisation domain-containing protein n=1 Tax=Oryza nivara TaxID=4536 RepID=A0A0E0IZQ8_ORYNI